MSNEEVILGRWGRTPLDEGRLCGSKPLIKILERAMEEHFVREAAAGAPTLAGASDPH